MAGEKGSLAPVIGMSWVSEWSGISGDATLFHACPVIAFELVSRKFVGIGQFTVSCPVPACARGSECGSRGSSNYGPIGVLLSWLTPDEDGAYFHSFTFRPDGRHAERPAEWANMAGSIRVGAGSATFRRLLFSFSAHAAC